MDNDVLGKEVDLTNMFLTQASSCDYENLCRLDVLGQEDTTWETKESFMKNLKNS